MAKKKAKKIEEEFDLEQAFTKVNPYLLEGLKKYIFVNGLDIKTQKEFDDLIKHYGGF